MEKYRKTIQRRLALLTILTLFAAGLGIYDVFGAPAAMKESAVFGFQCGVSMGFGVLSLALIIRYSRALRDETALRKLRNQENDERLRAIRAKAGQLLLLITSCAMILTGTVIGYWDAVIFEVLVKAAVAQLIISVAVKAVYMKRM